MVKVALTGGIGSGKSYVCRMLKNREISVYDCDIAAKRLMVESAELKEKLISVVGNNAYVDGKLNKAVLSCYLLKSTEHAKRINEIVHPAVAEDFIASGMTWMECALLFSSGFNRLVDKSICVTAPLDIRVSRIMNRDHISETKAREWIDNQMPQQEVVVLSDYELVNDGIADVETQLDVILKSIFYQ
ncbi:MAG: dephospho-CoA kinase [Prevotella sp.]|nr:dephospho-CoA kinase [Prevotella sp.]